MRLLKKLFHLPGPKELGWSEIDALPSKYSARKGFKTWEDWDVEMKKTYPIKYFFSQTLVLFFSINVINRIKDLYWGILYRFHPSHKHHLINIQCKDFYCDGYKYGYLDPDTKILLANFAILKEYVEISIEQDPNWVNHVLEPDELLGNSAEQHKEILDLYSWWVYDRPRTEKLISTTLNLWYEVNQKKDSPEHKVLASEYFKQLGELESYFEDKKTDSLVRLMKARNVLWHP